MNRAGHVLRHGVHDASTLCVTDATVPPSALVLQSLWRAWQDASGRLVERHDRHHYPEATVERLSRHQPQTALAGQAKDSFWSHLFGTRSAAVARPTLTAPTVPLAPAAAPTRCLASAVDEGPGPTKGHLASLINAARSLAALLDMLEIFKQRYGPHGPMPMFYWSLLVARVPLVSGGAVESSAAATTTNISSPTTSTPAATAWTPAAASVGGRFEPPPPPPISAHQLHTALLHPALPKAVLDADLHYLSLFLSGWSMSRFNPGANVLAAVSQRLSSARCGVKDLAAKPMRTLTSLLSSMRRLGMLTPALLANLAAAATARADAANPSEVAEMAFELAQTLQQPSAMTTTSYSHLSSGRSGDSDSSSSSSSCAATALDDGASSSLVRNALAALGGAAQRHLARYSRQDLVQLVTSLVIGGCASQVLLHDAADCFVYGLSTAVNASRPQDRQDGRDAARLLAAYGAAGHLHVMLIESLSGVVLQHLAEVDLPALASALRGVAALGFSQSALFAAAMGRVLSAVTVAEADSDGLSRHVSGTLAGAGGTPVRTTARADGLLVTEAAPHHSHVSPDVTAAMDQLQRGVNWNTAVRPSNWDMAVRSAGWDSAVRPVNLDSAVRPAHWETVERSVDPGHDAALLSEQPKVVADLAVAFAGAPPSDSLTLLYCHLARYAAPRLDVLDLPGVAEVAKAFVAVRHWDGRLMDGLATRAVALARRGPANTDVPPSAARDPPSVNSPPLQEQQRQQQQQQPVSVLGKQAYDWLEAVAAVVTALAKLNDQVAGRSVLDAAAVPVLAVVRRHGGLVPMDLACELLGAMAMLGWSHQPLESELLALVRTATQHGAVTFSPAAALHLILAHIWAADNGRGDAFAAVLAAPRVLMQAEHEWARTQVASDVKRLGRTRAEARRLSGAAAAALETLGGRLLQESAPVADGVFSVALAGEWDGHSVAVEVVDECCSWPLHRPTGLSAFRAARLAHRGWKLITVSPADVVGISGSAVGLQRYLIHAIRASCSGV